MTLDAAHACVIDLDGVVWLAGSALPGAAQGVSILRDCGIAVRFATNNSAPTVGDLVHRLAAAGIDADPSEVVTSAQAAASMLAAGERAYVLGGDGITEALHAAGVDVVRDGADAVVVGLATRFDYAQLDEAARLVRAGARLIATNLDPTLPTASGLRPGAGAIAAAVSTAAGTAPEIAGKPAPAMCALVCSRGAVGAVIGDRASTDGAFAAALGVPFAHVQSQADDPAPTAVVHAASLLDAVRHLLA